MKHVRQENKFVEGTAERFYRALLSLYPAEHRESYEIPMLQLFRDIYRHEVNLGGYRSVLKFWAFILKDAAKSIFLEHLKQGVQPMIVVSSFKPGVSAGVGFVLLSIPSYFIGASLLRIDAPGLRYLANPIILLGGLFIAVTLNVLSILSVRFRKDTPSMFDVSLSLRFWNIAVISMALIFLGVLLSYAFVENFQQRSVG